MKIIVTIVTTVTERVLVEGAPASHREIRRFCDVRQREFGEFSLAVDGRLEANSFEERLPDAPV